MISWAMVPALRLALALAVGIAAAAFVPGPQARWLVTSGLCATATFLLWPVGLQWRTLTRGLGVLCAVSSVGLVLAVRDAPLASTTPTPVGSASSFVVELDQIPTRAGKWLRADGRVVKLRADSVWHQTDLRVRLMLDTAYGRGALGRGALLVSRSRLERPKPPLNPHTFDYQAYLSTQGIRLQSWIRPGEARTLASAKPASPIERIRGSIASKIEDAFPGAKEAGVALALLIGDKSAVDRDTRDDYVRAGAVHVLAVSGLHTGIIAAIITFLLRGLGKRVRWLQILALWLGLACYVALTGYAPSVQRAAVMFGILFAGRLARLDSNGFNSLGLSAIILLLANPGLLFDLGFQLSFLAVGGILGLYPTLNRQLRSRYRLLNWLGQSVAVGLAATLATAPLTVYYFHQFPLYFALSGCFAVPLVGATLWFLLAGLAVQAVLGLFGMVAAWTLLPGYACVWLMNYGLAQVTELPAALVEGLWPSLATCVLALACVAFLAAAALRRKFHPALAAGLCFVACSLSYAFDDLSKSRVAEITTYSLRSGQLTDIIAGGKVVSLAQKPAEQTELTRSVTPHRSAYNLSVNQTPGIVDSVTTSIPGLTAYSALGKVWLVLPESVHQYAKAAPAVDFALVQETRDVDPALLASALPATPLVLTQRIPPWRSEPWGLQKLPVHELPVLGCYTLLVIEE